MGRSDLALCLVQLEQSEMNPFEVQRRVILLVRDLTGRVVVELPYLAKRTEKGLGMWARERRAEFERGLDYSLCALEVLLRGQTSVEVFRLTSAAGEAFDASDELLKLSRVGSCRQSNWLNLLNSRCRSTIWSMKVRSEKGQRMSEVNL